jgi:hypothetical protein
LKELTSQRRLKDFFLSYSLISDFAALNGIHSISLTHCYKMTDHSLQYLGNSYKVELYFIDSISSLNALKNVPFIFVSQCPQLSDISEVGNNLSVIIESSPLISEAYLEGKYQGLEK